jgi:UDP-N-acetylmuramoyl-L-alanyl-D-glutamate--2,6-diaminopimelate ligase
MSAVAGGLSLSEIVRELPLVARVEGDAATRVTGVQQDSRHVGTGDLFVARSGAHAHGARFIADAVTRGAAAVLCTAETVVPDGLPSVRVADVPGALAFAASAVYGHPSFSLDVVGVTGTNGKTTTTHLVRAAIDGALGARRCGTIGTVGHDYDGLTFDAVHTTPESDELARVLAAFRDAGASHVAMEVSSIALATGRVRAVRFRVAAFTNLTLDHLDFHGSMERYAAAKAELFTESLPGAAVVHVDDPFGRALAQKVKSPLVRVSSRIDGAPADIAPTSLTFTDRGIVAALRTPTGPIELESCLIGAHNVENLVVALGVVYALELSLPLAGAALAKERGAPGRLERCEEPEDDVTVLVDYAHTPDALGRALDAVRPIARGRVLCVFGCGGDRDRTKRAPMGRAASAGADLVIVTNDNPRSENPESIASSIVEGVRSTGLAALDIERLSDAPRGYAVELDRALAISAAVMAARKGDVLLIAGKGHETYQISGDDRRAFDDRAHARAALAHRRRAVPKAG